MCVLCKVKLDLVPRLGKFRIGILTDKWHGYDRILGPQPWYVLKGRCIRLDRLKVSVPDPLTFSTNPDPRIRTLTIRYLCRYLRIKPCTTKPLSGRSNLV
jgi:hypothetical protein